MKNTYYQVIKSMLISGAIRRTKNLISLPIWWETQKLMTFKKTLPLVRCIQLLIISWFMEQIRVHLNSVIWGCHRIQMALLLILKTSILDKRTSSLISLRVIAQLISVNKENILFHETIWLWRFGMFATLKSQSIRSI